MLCLLKSRPHLIQRMIHPLLESGHSVLQGGLLQSIGSMLKNYSVLKLLWEECLEQRLLIDIKGRLIGVKVHMFEFHVLFGLNLCDRILEITDNLSASLQGESMSAADGQDIAEKNIQTL